MAKTEEVTKVSDKRPDRTVTQAHVLVLSETLTEREMEIDLAERLKGLEVDSVEVKRVNFTYRDVRKENDGS